MKILALILGSVFAGASMKLFLFPMNIPSGGAAGITVVVAHFLPVPLGATLFVVNAFLLVLAWRLYGIGFVLRTLLTVSLMSWTVDHITHGPLIAQEWLSAGVGALCFGLSMSLILYSGSTSGGMDILAKFLEHKWGTAFGTNLCCINTLILISAGILLGWHVALFGICVQVISNSTINTCGKIRVALEQARQHRHEHKLLTP